jgi:hypothetical protein
MPVLDGSGRGKIFPVQKLATTKQRQQDQCVRSEMRTFSGATLVEFPTLFDTNILFLDVLLHIGLDTL